MSSTAHVTAASRVVLILLVAVTLAAGASHITARHVGIAAHFVQGRKQFGVKSVPISALVAGSSLSYDGIDWDSVGTAMGIAIESWPVPGSSPAEWEQLQRRSPHAATTFVGVSLYDLNEGWLCDYRADLVPLRQTMRDLWDSDVDPRLARRIWSAYTQRLIRALFPTAGRSVTVLAGLRDSARAALGRGATSSPSESPLQLAADYTSDERSMDLPAGHLLRRLESMRATQGTVSFRGPKHLALTRLVGKAKSQGRVVVVVLPVSPPYRSALLEAADLNEFERSLANVQRGVPGVTWIRLDRRSDLGSAEHFYDLVHLNMQGRRVATAALIAELRRQTAEPLL